MSRKILIILSLTLISLVLVVGCSKKESSSDKNSDKNVSTENEINDKSNNLSSENDSNENSNDIVVGEAAPNFTLKDLDGNDVSLKDYRDKIVLINFWATTCGYCREEMPYLQKISSENEDLVVLSVDVMEDKPTVNKFIKENGYTFPVLLDEDGKVASTYLVSGFPTAYFIDKDGTLLGRKVGFMDYDQMNSILKDIRENTLKVGE
ncbi:alkyl hydroperoxide reductase/ thiol specific antioxidant/ mal allergen [Gottschalkia acidurici 9a]|uniref:Alkyl hydroperoxide reductase/ thiol specific antioxidant/ mal allergen n=1 Tax=Gottschalkia acidurici (strain ATCC 7906 / DSM 604 / BCRC 14475 / CIP 104303 / KCTC 5404 / NCIMB 10678 / 9a) TaxID=1128398 RepID=K0AWR0_GOTA9|nr:TlpA disulfide reductase family protein [Gottschalkia acidurici]AFS77170.1 alkyl hydroperoxide reductase/ thiol specific antioxidant/ mal allergen [Gottschalkia acidurici 9a]